MKTQFVFTSESVTEGHPDKLCDQISDAIVDEFLRQDPLARVSTECAVARGVIFIAARFAAAAAVDIPEIARSIVRQVGYEQGEFNAQDCSVLTQLSEFKADEYMRKDERDMGDDELDNFIAKDQVTEFGYACRQTPAFMPLPIWLAHKLARRMSAVRFKGLVPFLGPDGKTQVGIEFINRKPHRIHSITLVASQRDLGEAGFDKLKEALYGEVIEPVFHDESLRPDRGTKVFLNPDGAFTGGPSYHAGLTGRKTAVDSYGEYCRHSGAALSGKDPLRIDRIGAYAARFVAKNVVAAKLADECEVQLSYTIGLAEPVSINVETYGTGRINDDEIARRIERVFDLRLGAIMRDMRLRRLPGEVKQGFYRRLAAYGHMGRMDMGLPWETTAMAPALID
jgi:S-adenosylmethionine synthetase